MRCATTIRNEIIEKKAELRRCEVERDSKKLTINGSFGKFGSKYSFLFAPKLLVQVTITGQLALLTLIGWLERNGIKVVSANTDGIVVKYHKVCDGLVDQIVSEWEKDTGYTMESTDYSAIYSRDVNNYFAIKPDGTFKGKGIFAPTGLMKNPNAAICYQAITGNALHCAPIEETIRNCTDITKFITVRTVRGGAMKDDVEVGKVIRWVHSTATDTAMHYKTNGNKVPASDGCRPVMDLPDELPRDIDYDWYINETHKIMESCGYEETNW